MMCYSGKDDAFPLTMKQCQCIYEACDKRIIEMEEDLESPKVDTHEYLTTKETFARVDGFIKLMQAKERTRANVSGLEII